VRSDLGRSGARGWSLIDCALDNMTSGRWEGVDVQHWDMGVFQRGCDCVGLVVVTVSILLGAMET
jgi:hypothetical protein